MTNPVRIGNAQAFWGDHASAAAEMLDSEPELDYLTLDYLAEVSMSILARQRESDPAGGFARDFLDVIRSLAPYWASGGNCRLIANAGGLNPRGCAEACRDVLAKTGCPSRRIAVVTGDDVLEKLRLASAAPASTEYRNLDTGEAIGRVHGRLVTANAYLGAAPIVEALAAGAEIVITGRVADPSPVVAACVHHFGWADDDLNRLAGATVAGHLIECGTQVTGGISTDWLSVPGAAQIGFPIVEVAEDGSCIVTKPRGTGGCVTAMTVKEQLVYEIGDPASYLSPDVTVSFLSLDVNDLGADRVQVRGATGKPRPQSLKVSATFRDGFRSAGSLTVIGRDAAAKARRCGEIVLRRVREAGHELRENVVECLGTGDAAGGVLRPRDDVVHGLDEVVLRVAVESESREAADCFARELMPMITAGPQGTTGYAEGRPRVHELLRYWPCLIARGHVTPRVELLSGSGQEASPPAPRLRRQQAITCSDGPISSEHHPDAVANIATPPVHLYDIACARSGDKGTSANVGVIARRDKWWPFLGHWLTAERVSTYFAPLGIQSVERFELPNIRALNFVIRSALRHSLRTDAQGKALGQILLEMRLPEDGVRTISQDWSAPEKH